MPLKADVFRRIGAFALIAAAAGLLAGCEDNLGAGNASRGFRPLAPEMVALMEREGTTPAAPVLIRTYKKEAEFEIWKMRADGKYGLLKTYPMCRWSGQLGPKVREGDRQVPEGFYAITPGQMNPNSAYYLSFNVGYPNAYDRALGHTGGSIMVHGVCSSAGCFSMTDEQIAEIYAVAREGFNGGQRAIQMQSFPFHMTAENLAKYRLDPNIAFWKQLKQGADNFDVSHQEVAIGVCNRHYVFNETPANGSHFDATAVCPPMKQDETLRNEVAAKEQRDNVKVAELVAKGMPAIHTVYADGGQNAQFASRVGEVSRPDALAQGAIDIPLDDGRGKKGAKGRKLSPVVQLAAKSKAAPEKAETVAVMAPAAPAPAPAAAKPAGSLLSRWFSKTPAVTPPPVAVEVNEPATPVPANVPLPPRRQAASTAKSQSVVTKPQAFLGADAFKSMRGAPVALPADLSAYATTTR